MCNFSDTKGGVKEKCSRPGGVWRFILLDGLILFLFDIEKGALI
jgi:hypothetical protein